MQRRLAELLPAGSSIDAPHALELSALGVQEAPRLITASLLEDASLRAHPVGVRPPAAARFAAFLDGTQTSRTVAHLDEIPIVHGSAAAVVRQRVDRRMRTWGEPTVSHALYAPLSLLTAAWRDALTSVGLPVVDTVARGGPPESPHPFALQDAAIHAVQAAREGLEQHLADEWCGHAAGELLVDGTITGSERVATSQCVVGVVKSHRTLYAEGEALRALLRLGPGERTSVFRITSPRRTPVASWYLRLRDARGRDPLWGLVRVEVAEQRDAASTTISARADEVSRWVLAEALPLAVPDGRWDKMVYGIRDCEEFLRSIQ